MLRNALLLIAFLGLAAGCSRSPQAVLEDTIAAMGATNLKSIQFSGTGASYALGQSVHPNNPWPKANLTNYSNWIDYDAGASREEMVRDSGFRPNLTQYLSGNSAWITLPDVPAPLPAPGAVAERQLQIVLTPHGFLKAARQSNPTLTPQTVGGKNVTVVSFKTQGKYGVSGTINDQNLVESVETRFPNPVLGDMLIKNTFSDYKDFSGVKFPGRIVQQQGDYPVLELTVSSARPNVTAGIPVPEAARPPTPPRVESQKLADGVWLVDGGSHHSLAVEFKDFLTVVEGPLADGRSLAVMAEVKKLVPNKPIRYLVNTHHHFDHSGGLRAFVAEGATIVTHEMNRPLYEKMVQAPHTLEPDSLSKAAAPAKFETFTDKHVLSDGTRTMELYLVQGSEHNAGILMAYLPKERILSEADLYNPGGPPGAEPPPGAPNPAAANLLDNIQRLKLNVARIAPIHGRVVPFAEFRKAAGGAS